MITWLKFLIKVICVMIFFFISFYIVSSVLLEIINSLFINPLIEEKNLLVVTHTEMTVFFVKSYMSIGLISFVTIFSILLSSQVKK